MIGQCPLLKQVLRAIVASDLYGEQTVRVKGQPEWVVEEYGAKRYYEYEVGSVWMARIILDLKGWIKTRKGMLSLTAKDKKGFIKHRYGN